MRQRAATGAIDGSGVRYGLAKHSRHPAFSTAATLRFSCTPRRHSGLQLPAVVAGPPPSGHAHSSTAFAPGPGVVASGGHAPQAVAEARSWKVAGGHCSHPDAPPLAWYLPAAHTRQAVAAAGENDPAGHAAHPDAAGSAPNVPAAHCVQSVARGAGE